VSKGDSGTGVFLCKRGVGDGEEGEGDSRLKGGDWGVGETVGRGVKKTEVSFESEYVGE
jgi:hypothetical protein